MNTKNIYCRIEDFIDDALDVFPDDEKPIDRILKRMDDFSMAMFLIAGAEADPHFATDLWKYLKTSQGIYDAKKNHL